jgi:cytoskeletal protein CcmA (bactofilin family)
MTQYVINIGAIPNDGTGDPLRTAFNETNLNFDQVFTAGPVLSNIRIANNTVLTTNTNGNLILAPNGTAVVQSNVSILPNLANLRNLGSATQRWATIYAQSLNVSSGTSVNGNLTVDGNLIVMGNVINMGNIVTDTLTIQLANTTTTANAANGAGITVGATDDIATMLYNSAGNVWAMNIGLNTPNIVVNNISSDDSTFVTVQDGLDVQGDITAETVSAVGNISGGYIFGNISQATGFPATYSNANVVTLLAGFGSNTVSTTGNISGGYFFGNVSQANGFPAGYANANAVAYGEAGWAGNIVPSGNAVYSLGNSTNQWNDLYVSNTTIYMNNVPVSLTAGNVLTVNGNAVLQNNSNSTISTTGNITADYFFGDGSQLTGISTANIGNVTFDDVNVIGTGDLNLQPNGASSEYLNIYLTGAADIHVAYGGGSGNVILGTDEQANVAVLLDGNVAIQAGNVAGTKTWTFDTAGNLTLPMGGVVYETNIPDGALSGSAIALTPPGGTNADQQLLIYPTVNDANHLHLTTGNLYNTELFLGNDNLYVKLANTGNIVVNSNDAAGNSAQWTFDTTGNATFPANGTTNLHDVVSVGLATFSNVRIGGNLNYAESANLIVVENKDGFADIIAQNQNAGGNASMNIVLVNNDPGNVYMAVGVNSSTFTPLYNTLFEIPDAGYVSHSITQVMGPQSAESGNSSMFFTYSSGSYALELNANGAIGWGASYNGNLTQGNFGNVGQVLTSAGANSPPTWNNFSSIANGTSNVNIATANGNVTIAANASSTWTFSTSGNLSAPGNVSAVGNVTGNYIFGNGSQLTGLPATYGNANVATFLAAYGSNTISTSGNVTAGNIIGNISITGNVQGTTANVTLVAGSYNWTFDNTGNLTLPGNTFAVNYANNTPVDVVTRFESSWTVPTGNSTQSFTVTGNNSYQMWVEGNIPNGIIVWNATGTVTNTNVPVIGYQYAWNYEGGGNILMFTSIPDQIIGTAGVISNAQPAVANTNVFSFGINNTSGNAVTVRYGWIQIS